MRNRTLVLLVFAAAVALAGCGGLGGTTTDATNATNGTMAATDGSPATATPGGGGNGDVDYPPGVTEAGLTNATALFEADWTALNESGFAASATLNRSAGGATLTLVREGRIAAGGQDALLRNEERTANGTVETTIWRNETVGLNRINERGFESGTATLYRQQSDIGRIGANPFYSGPTAGIIALGNYDVASVDGTGADTRITLTADAANESRASQLRVDVTSYESELVVDPTGRVRAADTTVETGGQRAATISIDYELRETADVTVDRPDWFETGASEAPDVTVSAELVNESYVALTNEGTDALAAGWQVQLRTGLRPISVSLPAAVERGETVYVSYPADGQELRVTESAPSETGSPISGARGVTVVEVSPSGRTYPVAGTALGGTGQP
jgi:hypothetical protein